MQPGASRMLESVLRIDLANGVNFGSADIRAIGSSCPALRELALGDNEEHGPIQGATDDGVLNVLSEGGFPNLLELCVSLTRPLPGGPDLLPSLASLPATLTSVDLLFNAIDVRTAVAAAANIPSLSQLIIHYHRDNEVFTEQDDIFAGLQAAENLCFFSYGHGTEVPQPLSAANLRSLLECRNLESIEIMAKASEDAAAALLGLPQLQHLVMSHVMPYYLPGGGGFQGMAAREHPLESFRLGYAGVLDCMLPWIRGVTKLKVWEPSSEGYDPEDDEPSSCIMRIESDRDARRARGLLTRVVSVDEDYELARLDVGISRSVSLSLAAAVAGAAVKVFSQVNIQRTDE